MPAFFSVAYAPFFATVFSARAVSFTVTNFFSSGTHTRFVLRFGRKYRRGQIAGGRSKENLDRFLNRADKRGHGEFLVAPRIFEAVDERVRGINAQRLGGMALIRRKQRVEQAGVHFLSLAAHAAEKCER